MSSLAVKNQPQSCVVGSAGGMRADAGKASQSPARAAMFRMAPAGVQSAQLSEPGARRDGQRLQGAVARPISGSSNGCVCRRPTWRSRPRAYRPSGRSTRTTLLAPTRSRSRVTRRAVTRGARVLPDPWSKSTMPASCSFLSVRDRLETARCASVASSLTEAGRRVTISRSNSRLSSHSSLTIAPGEAFAPSALAAVASLSNQRLGVAVAAAGSLTTRLFSFMNSPIVTPFATVRRLALRGRRAV